MAFIYEVNGVKVEFDKEPTDADIDEAALSLGNTPKPKKKGMGDYAKDFGKATASLADTGINAVTGTLDQGAYALARAAGRTPEQATQETTSPKDVIGRAFGITQDPAYQGEASRQLGQAAGSVINEYAVQPITQATGLPEQDVGNMLGTVSMGAAPYVKPAMQAAGRGVQSVAEGTVNAGKGFARGLAYPNAASPDSALMPIRPTYVPHPEVGQFMQGKIPASSLTERPTAPLYQNDPVTNWAYGMAPENQAGQKLVSAAGKGVEGFAEQLGSTYRQQPLNMLADIGGTMLTGIPAPITAIRKAVPAFAARKLQQATNFEPNFAAAREAALQTEGRAGIEAGMPTQPLLPAPGPVAPTLYANQQGVVTGPKGQSVPQQLSSAGSSTPKEAAMQLAASKLQPVAPTPSVPPAQQQSWASRSAGGYTPPATEPITQAPVQQAPKVTKPAPVKPTPIEPSSTVKELENKINEIDRQSSELHAQNVGTTKQGTPEGVSYQQQMDELYSKYKEAQAELEAVKKAEKEAGRKSNKGKAKEDKQVPLTKSVKMTGAEGKIDFTHSNPDRSKLFGTLNDGTKVEVHTTTDPVTIFDITDPKKPTKIAEFGGGGKQTFGNPLPSKKAPSNVSQMLTDDGSATWNSMKMPDNASPAEQRIAKMSQAERDRLQSQLEKTLSKEDPLHNEYLGLFEKYRMK